MDPKVTVILPVYNAAPTLREAIDSILAQDYNDWEMLIINEAGSDDGSAEIATGYEEADARVKLVQNKAKLGLAQSLNLGMLMARGEYLARLDADDISLPSRLAKQVDFLDSNPHIAVCGSWQRHTGTEQWVHKPPSGLELCRAYLLFFCNLCHSTLMLRKSTFIENKLFYDPNYLMEDFELWSRAIGHASFSNIQEILGEYRHGKQNITEKKRRALDGESGKIIAASLARYLNVSVPPDCLFLLNTWENLYLRAFLSGKRRRFLAGLEGILRQVWQANLCAGYCDEGALLSVIQAKWRWAKFGFDWKEYEQAGSLEEIFRERRRSALIELMKRLRRSYPSFSVLTRNILKKAFWRG